MIAIEVGIRRDIAGASPGGRGQRTVRAVLDHKIGRIRNIVWPKNRKVSAAISVKVEQDAARCGARACARIAVGDRYIVYVLAFAEGADVGPDPPSQTDVMSSRR